MPPIWSTGWWWRKTPGSNPIQRRWGSRIQHTRMSQPKEAVVGTDRQLFVDMLQRARLGFVERQEYVALESMQGEARLYFRPDGTLDNFSMEGV